jgi:ankyrin repeat protein
MYNRKGTVPPVGLAHPMRTVADNSIFGLPSSFSDFSFSNFSEVNLQQMYIYGGGGEVGLQLQMSIAEFLRLSNADVADIGCSLLSSSMILDDQQTTLVNEANLQNLSSSKDEGNRMEANAANKIERRNKIGFKNRNKEQDAEKELYLYQPTVSKKSGVSNNNNPAINSLKMARKEKWLLNSNAEAFTVFDTKLLRDYAMLEDSTSFVKMLALYDASPESFPFELESATPSGKTALHLAAWKGPVETVRALLDRGANVNTHSTSPGNYGKSAIFYAITRSRDDMVVELLQRGAKVKIVNNKGQTPLSLAVSHLEEETILSIETAEKNQEALLWANFRLSHSDSKPYGDLVSILSYT